MKAALVVGCIAIVLAIFPTMSVLGQAELPKVTLKLGHVMQIEHALHKGCLRMAEYVSMKTGGKFQIRVYPSRQLGDERDVIVNTMLGTIDMTANVLGAYGAIYPPAYIGSFAYVFKDLDHANRVYNSKIGTELLKGLAEQKKTRVLQPLLYYGLRHLTTTSVPIREPADLKGLKIRTPPVLVHRASVQAMGCVAVPVAWGELYLALKQGLVDGQENPLPAIKSAALYEVQKYLMLTGHIIAHVAVAINENVYQNLPKKYQKILYEGNREGAKINDELISKEESELAEEFAKKVCF